jgi:hypothetical protein
MFGQSRLAKTGSSLAALVTTVALLMSVAGPASATTGAGIAAHRTSISQSVSHGIAAGAVTGRQIQSLKAKCSGKNNHSVQWFGPQMKLDSCNTNRLIAAAGAGSAIIIGILAVTGVGVAAAAVVAAVLGVVVGAIAWCAANGNGVIIDESWAGQVWCASQ